MILTSMKGGIIIIITVITLSDVPLEGMEDFSALVTATNPSVTVFNPRAMVTIIEEGDVQDCRVPDKLLMPEAVCCCLQTCKCGFDIRVVLCASAPSLLVRNANTTKL